MAEILTIRKLADRSEGERVAVHDPLTGAKHLVRPEALDELFADAASLEDFSARVAALHTPWPSAGIAIEGEPPAVTNASTGWVDAAAAEGWLERENERVVHRPGGRPDKPWGTTHTFVHADAIVIKTVDGDVRYRVTGQPDKYHDGPAGTDAVGDPTAEVRHFYALALEG